MAETDLLPEIGWDYPLHVPSIDGVLRQRAENGLIFQRLRSPDLRIFELEKRAATTLERQQLDSFYRRFQASFFRFDQKVWVDDGGTYRTRSFPVVFNGPQDFALGRNESWPISVTLIEAVGKALPAGKYPDPTLGHASFLIEEDDPQRAVALRGTWTTAADGQASAGNHKTNPGTTGGANADAFQFTYAGYGFRLHSIKDSNLGIYEVLLDETSLGNVDLYNATKLPAAPVFTKLEVPLGIHRVELRSTNTRNVGNVTAFTIIADAIEIMP
ncbi:hypothetical protein LCGC14_1540640 [marine sediment metagenome]|uniref:Uncharacterized protein n=1 Tax=marine sediment metagenome TaxID=412755 RepID=A0A0F9IT75_9ZZZZ